MYYLNYILVAEHSSCCH